MITEVLSLWEKVYLCKKNNGMARNENSNYFLYMEPRASEKSDMPVLDVYIESWSSLLSDFSITEEITLHIKLIKNNDNISALKKYAFCGLFNQFSNAAFLRMVTVVFDEKICKESGFLKVTCTVEIKPNECED